MAQILTIAKKVAGALGTKVKVPVLDAELKLPPEVLRIVGAVAAGAIIESGSNANGQYIKYADGGLICTNTPVLLGYAIPPDQLSWGIGPIQPVLFLLRRYLLLMRAYTANTLERQPLMSHK